MTIAWTTVEDAIQTWVKTATSLGGASVIWSEQNGPRPTSQYVEIGVELERRGQDWIDTDDAAAPSAENELDYFSRGTRTMTIRLRCFGGSSTGVSSAKALLENVVSQHRLPSIHNALIVAGIGVSTFSRVTNITGVLNSTKLEPRAMLDITAFLSSEVSETGTYVSDVEVTNLTTGDVFTVEGGV